MSLKKSPKIGIINFIHPDDSAINTDINEETGKPFSDLEKYRETWDFEKYCVLKEGCEPTILKLNYALSYRKSQAIKNATIGGSKDDFGFKLGNHQYQIVRSILVDIVNPESTPLAERFIFKRDGNDLVSIETMEDLEQSELIDDIYSFYLATKKDNELLKKK